MPLMPSARISRKAGRSLGVRSGGGASDSPGRVVLINCKQTREEGRDGDGDRDRTRAWREQICFYRDTYGKKKIKVLYPKGTGKRSSDRCACRVQQLAGLR